MVILLAPVSLASRQLRRPAGLGLIAGRVY